MPVAGNASHLRGGLRLRGRCGFSILAVPLAIFTSVLCLASLAHFGLLLVDHHYAGFLRAPFGQLQVIPWDRAGLFDDLEEKAELV